jgi:MYXO-CTERM domain-containing protein
MAAHLDGPILPGTNGDLNSDQKVDLADFRLFKESFPGGVAAFEAALAGVPEPSGGVLAILAMGGLAHGRRRRTS